MNNYASFGKITSSHGLNGNVKVYCYFENYEYFLQEATFFLKEGESFTQKNITLKGGGVNGILLNIEGINNVDEAKKLTNKEIFILADDFEKFKQQGEDGTHYVEDIIGLDVYKEGEETPFGKVADVLSVNGSALLEIENISKKTLEYYHKSSSIVKEINLNKNSLILYESIF